MANNRTYAVPNAQNAMKQMKTEVASTLGVNLGGDTSARQNGSVGGEITKRLVQIAEQSFSGRR